MSSTSFAFDGNGDRKGWEAVFDNLPVGTYRLKMKETLASNTLAVPSESFGCEVLEIDGHNFDDIVMAVGEAQAVFEKPSIIITRTIPGKGVSSFERKPEWHGKAPKKDEGDIALEELRTLGGRIEKE